MYHVYTLTSANESKPHTIGLMPGSLPETTRVGDWFEIIHSFQTEVEANAYRQQLEKYYDISEVLVVLCNQTGEIFSNAFTAANHHNLTYSALHNHLKRKRGHKTVKGRTYNYIKVPKQ